MDGALDPEEAEPTGFLSRIMGWARGLVRRRSSSSGMKKFVIRRVVRTRLCSLS